MITILKIGDKLKNRADGLTYQVDCVGSVGTSWNQQSLGIHRTAGFRCVEFPFIFWGYTRWMDVYKHFELVK